MAFNVYQGHGVNAPLVNGNVGTSNFALVPNATPGMAFSNVGPQFVSPQQASSFAAIGAPKHGPFFNPHKNEFLITQELQVVVIHQYINSKSSLLLNGIIPIAPLTANIIRSTYIDFGAPVAQNAAPFTTPTIAGYTKYADITHTETIAFAVNMEIGAMKTREGSIIFNELLVQLQHAFFNKFEISTVDALYKTQNSASVWKGRGSRSTNFNAPVNALDVLLHEYKCFNACRKDYALHELVLHIQQSISGDASIIPDTLLAPYSGILNANLNPVVSTYAHNGDDAKRARSNAGDTIQIPGSSIDMVVPLSNHNNDMNFLNTTTYIGEIYPFFNGMNEAVNAIRIWNYGTSSWNLLRASDCLKSSKLFGSDGFLSNDYHDDTNSDHGGLRYERVQDNKWTYAKYFGELGEKMLVEEYERDIIKHITQKIGTERANKIQESFDKIKQINDEAKAEIQSADETKKIMNNLARQFIYFRNKGFKYVYLNTPEFKKTAFTYEALQFACEHAEEVLKYDPKNSHVDKLLAAVTGDPNKKSSVEDYINNTLEVDVGFSKDRYLYKQLLADFLLFHKVLINELPGNALLDLQKDSSYYAGAFNKKLSQRVLWYTLFNNGSAVIEVPDYSLKAIDGFLKIGIPTSVDTEFSSLKITEGEIGFVKDAAKTTDVELKDISKANPTVLTIPQRVDNAKNLILQFNENNTLSAGQYTLNWDISDVAKAKETLDHAIKILILKHVIKPNTDQATVKHLITEFGSFVNVDATNISAKIDQENIDNLSHELTISQNNLVEDFVEKATSTVTKVNFFIQDKLNHALNISKNTAFANVSTYTNTFISLYFSTFPNINTTILFRLADSGEVLYNAAGVAGAIHNVQGIGSLAHTTVNNTLPNFNFIQGIADNVVDAENTTLKYGQFGSLVELFTQLRTCNTFMKRVAIFFDKQSGAILDDYIRFIMYFQPFSEDSLASMMHNGTPVPFGLLGVRPAMSFDTSCIFVLKRGAGTGVLYVGNELFLQSQDAGTGQYALTLRMDIAPHIMRPDAISIIKAAHVEKYLAGGGMNFLFHDSIEKNVENLGSTDGLIAYFIPYGTEPPSFIPLRGKSFTEMPSNFVRYKISTNDILEKYPLDGTFYDFFNNIYNFDKSQSSDDLDVNVNKIPLLCVKGAYQYPIGNGRFELQTSPAYIENPENLFKRVIPRL